MIFDFVRRLDDAAMCSAGTASDLAPRRDRAPGFRQAGGKVGGHDPSAGRRPPIAQITARRRASDRSACRAWRDRQFLPASSLSHSLHRRGFSFGPARAAQQPAQDLEDVGLVLDKRKKSTSISSIDSRMRSITCFAIATSAARWFCVVARVVLIGFAPDTELTRRVGRVDAALLTQRGPIGRRKGINESLLLQPMPRFVRAQELLRS